MTNSHYSFKMGQFDCRVIKDGGNPRAATAFLSDAPVDELEQIVRRFKADPALLNFSINILLIKTGEHTVLVDTGLGLSNLPERLDVDAGAVDTVIITHGHGDHIGGILTPEGEFVYPQAHYFLWQTEWDYWTAPERYPESDTSHSKKVWQMLKAHPERVTPVSGSADEAEIMPGIRAVATPGHTPGHIALLIESGVDRLLHVADAAHQPFQLACPQWSPGFDYDKPLAAETRRQLFERAAREQVTLFGYHFPFPGMGRVISGSDGPGWQEV